jgi:adenosyl cobinamide kinase/adenosyl cobinamide phosphate guanylyltransferase
MPDPLKNVRHERFAQELAKGKSQLEAYVAAGYKPDRGAATRLSANVSVRDRVLELTKMTTEKVVEKTGIDAAWVLKKAAELHATALKEKQFSVAKGALDIIGKHVDVQAFREQIQHSGLIEYKNLSDEEIEARIAAHEAARASSQPTTH